jgi:hypothetical protein
MIHPLTHRLVLSAFAVSVLLVVMTGCSYGSREGSAQYVDPRLFTAASTRDPNGPGRTNVFLHAKTLDIQRRDDHLVGVGPYYWVDAMAEIRDSDVDLPIVVEIAEDSLQHIDAPLRIGECYRFYGNAGGAERLRDPVTGVERWLPAVHAYNFELVAHDGFGGCKSP